jgi:hypothetical protein
MRSERGQVLRNNAKTKSLRNFSLRYITCRLEEIRALLTAQRGTITKFDGYCLYLLSGS